MVEMTFELLLAAVVFVILLELFRLLISMEDFKGMIAERVCLFKWGIWGILCFVRIVFCSWVISLNLLYFGSCELPICTKICTKTARLVLGQFSVGSTLVS